MKTLKLIYNIAGFKSAWWLCLLGPSFGMPYIGPAVMGLFIIVHFFIMRVSKHEMLFLVLAALAGTGIDSIKAASGVISYSGSYGSIDWIAPLWITAMWMGFAALINHSLSWLKGKPYLAFAMGAIFGPLAYLAGERVGALTFNIPETSALFLIALIWGIVMPVLFGVWERMGRTV